MSSARAFDEQIFTIDQALESVDDLIQKTISSSMNRHFLGIKITNLDILKKVLVGIKDGDSNVDINQAFEIESAFGGRTITCLNIAVTYCDGAVVDFLLRAGAKPDNDTVHHATVTIWPKKNKTLDVLVAHGVDLNSASSKDGHTALYHAKRNATQSKEFNPVVTSLTNHHATMFTSEQVVEPLLHAKDVVTQAVDSVTGFMLYPR